MNMEFLKNPDQQIYHYTMHINWAKLQFLTKLTLILL